MKVDCPSCGRTLRAPDEARGKQLRCPTCNHVFKLPPEEVVLIDEDAYAEPDDAVSDEHEDRPLRRGRRPGHHLEPHRATAVLVLGILGLVVMPIIFGPIAWTMGTTDLRKMQEGVMDPEGEQLTNAGRICGMIGTVFGLLCCGGYALLIVVGIMGELR